MITFLISLIALVLGYFVYGKYVENTFGPDDRQTPAVGKADGVDYMVLPGWKIFMIQFLNIAGTGPIFGAIMGAKFGPMSYLWIVLGCIFAGATHDYLSGMLSMRHDGAGLPEIIGKYLGRTVKGVMLVFTVFLLVLVGAVFVKSPADILTSMFDNGILWILLIFAYYIIATMLPVDKIIGKIYPIFAFSLLFMAAALMVVLLIRWYDLPEIWESGFVNLGKITHPDTFTDDIFPALFVTIACGAISGFHATQSPLMARCIKHEKMGRPIFYGSMITEGIVALIWATVAMYFFYGEPAGYDTIAGVKDGFSTGAPVVVNAVCNDWLGIIGGILAMLGVVAAPITSGDTALRSGRLIIAEWLKLDQKNVKNRLYISIPMFIVTAALLIWQMNNKEGFGIIWGYFGWANQTLAVFTLWTLTVYLRRKRKNYFITLFPALLMTAVCSSFLVISKNALGMSQEVGYAVAATIDILFLAIFIFKCKPADDSDDKFNKRKIHVNMRKFYLVLAMLAMTLAANAQFEQGKMFVGASLSSLDMNYSGSKGFNLGVNGQVGTFMTDNWLVYGQAGYEHVGKPENFNSFNAGLGARYYIVQNGLFLGANAKYCHSTGHYNDFKPGVELGYAFFVGKEMTIEPAIYYDQSFKNHSDYSTVGFKIGIGLYLGKNKIKNSVKEAFFEK